jgi:K+-transporting ATPase A subunit
MVVQQCPQCSKTAEHGENFCAACGSPLAGPVAATPTATPVENPTRSTNGMAIASLVLAISCCAPLAVIFGHIAKRQIRERGEDGGGLATAGLVIGYIGLALLALYVLGITALVLLSDG